MGLKESGTSAQALVTEDKRVFLKPQSLSFEEAAALPIVSGTAWNALIDMAKLQAGQRVFITGCVGGVGRVAARIAGMRGAEIAGSCSASRRMAGITEAVERGKLIPAVGRIAPLSEAISAVVELETTGLPKGKLVIVPTR